MKPIDLSTRGRAARTVDAEDAARQIRESRLVEMPDIGHVDTERGPVRSLSESVERLLAQNVADAEWFKRRVDETFNDAMGSVITGSGIAMWAQGEIDDGRSAFFGVDRDARAAFMHDYQCEWRPTLRERLVAAWRGLVRGWREG